MARIYVNNVAPISVDTCLVHSDKYAVSMVLTGNSMGSSEILDKYHSCCIGNGIGNGKFHEAKNLSPFPIQQEWYLSKISLLPMLLLVLITFLSDLNYLCTVSAKFPD